MRTKEELQRLFIYDEESGKLFWKLRPRDTFPTQGGFIKFNTNFAGKEAGSKDPDGGLKVGVLKKTYKVHRIIWALHYGYWPKQVDHIDGNRSNNKLENLRDVDQQENCRNRAISSINTSGTVGVYWHTKHKQWQSRIRVNGKLLHLGYFKTISDAVEARKCAEKEHGFHPNHGRVRA